MCQEWPQAKTVRRNNYTHAKPQAKSVDELVDSYFFQYMLSLKVQVADEAKLRNIARLMVDTRFSDRKKQIVVLQKLDFNLSEIARRLDIERQAVSSVLRSID